MPQPAAERAVVQAGERLEEIAQNASRLKSSVSDSVLDDLYRMRRTAKRSWYGAQNLIDDAAYKVKRHPFEAVAVATGAGFAIGFLVGWAVNKD